MDALNTDLTVPHSFLVAFAVDCVHLVCHGYSCCCVIFLPDGSSVDI